VTLFRLHVTVGVTLGDYAEPKKDARAAAEAGECDSGSGSGSASGQ
jgi:hypothetical protein